MTILFIIGLAASIILILGMASVVRGVVDEVEWSTDYTGDPGAATWTEIPVAQIMGDGFQNFAEEAQLVQTINGLDASAAKKGVGVFPIAPKDDDTFLTGLELAEAELTPTWFRVTFKGQTNKRIIGGDTGCLVYVNRNPGPEFAGLVSALVGFSATGAEPGDTFRFSTS
jgi:hypothetical protein